MGVITHIGIVTARAVTIPMCVITPIAFWIYLGLAEVNRLEAVKATRLPLMVGLVLLISGLICRHTLETMSLSTWVLGIALPLCFIIAMIKHRGKAIPSTQVDRLIVSNV